MSSLASPSATYTAPNSEPVIISAAPAKDLRAQKTYTETDVDVATEPNHTPLGDARRAVVDLQAKINAFLTEKLTA